MAKGRNVIEGFPIEMQVQIYRRLYNIDQLYLTLDPLQEFNTNSVT